jgi:hypothetical protein
MQGLQKFANDIKTTWLDKKLIESIAKHSTCSNNIHLTITYAMYMNSTTKKKMGVEG